MTVIKIKNEEKKIKTRRRKRREESSKDNEIEGYIIFFVEFSIIQNKQKLNLSLNCLTASLSLCCSEHEQRKTNQVKKNTQTDTHTNSQTGFSSCALTMIILLYY